MALVKNNILLLSGVGTTQLSSDVNVSDAYLASVYINILQSGTATTGASFQLQTSPDSGNSYYSGPLYLASTPSGYYNWILAVPQDATNVKLLYIQATGTSSICTSHLGKITSL